MGSVAAAAKATARAAAVVETAWVGLEVAGPRAVAAVEALGVWAEEVKVVEVAWTAKGTNHHLQATR